MKSNKKKIIRITTTPKTTTPTTATTTTTAVATTTKTTTTTTTITTTATTTPTTQKNDNGNSNNNNNNSNDNNHLTFAKLRFLPKRGRSSALEHTTLGNLGLAILTTPVLPNPSFPALGREDTTCLELGPPIIQHMPLVHSLMLP